MTKGRSTGAMAEAPASSVFTGIPPEAFEFFAGLAQYNNRKWFQARKADYERLCQAPLKALTVALDPPLGTGRLTRIYRDVRFSKDKSPYRTHVSATVSGLFLSLSAQGLYVGTGLYMPEPVVLRRLREAIDREESGKPLAALVASLRRKGYIVGSHESVATVPRGFAVDHPRLELLRMKDLHAGRMLEPRDVSSAGAVARVRRIRDEVAPLRAWLSRHAGAASCS